MEGGLLLRNKVLGKNGSIIPCQRKGRMISLVEVIFDFLSL